MFKLYLVMDEYGISDAGDISLGKEKSITCAKCHGAEGISEDLAIPNLAGQRYAYLYKQLIDFVDGLHRHGNMKEQLSSLSHDDIDGLATYYASLKPSVEKKGDPTHTSKGQ